MDRQSLFFIILSIIVAIVAGDLFIIHQQITSYKEMLLSKIKDKKSDKKEKGKINSNI